MIGWVCYARQYDCVAGGCQLSLCVAGLRGLCYALPSCMQTVRHMSIRMCHLQCSSSSSAPPTGAPSTALQVRANLRALQQRLNGLAAEIFLAMGTLDWKYLKRAEIDW